MKTHDIKVLQFVMHDKNLLLLSDNEFNDFNSIFEIFKTFVINEINPHNINHTSAILMQENTDVVIINCNQDKDTTIKIIEEIRNHDEKIPIVIILPSHDFEKNIDTINYADFVLVDPFTNSDLSKKLYNSLNDTCSIKTTIKTESEKGENSEDVEVFLDTFEGEILFLNEELIEYVRQIENGELSHELLSEISAKMKEVSVVFSRHNYTKKVSPIFTNLASYLELLDIQKIEIENLEGFVFLARIIDDIQNYLFEYFVSRIFVDVYVFEDSLKNSIQFMQDRLKTSDTSHDDSELNFFDD